MVPNLKNHIKIFHSSDENVLVFNSITKKTYSIGQEEAHVLSLLDGNKTIEEISFECPFFTVSEIDELIAIFDSLGFFLEEKEKINPLKIRVRLFNPNSLFKHNSVIANVFSFILTFISPLLFLFAVFVSVYAGHKGILPDANQMNHVFGTLSYCDWICIFIIALLSLFAHEMAHTIVARRYDICVPEFGLMLYCLVPCAYVNISGIHLLKNRGKRILILCSGSLVNLLISGLALILIPFFHSHIVAILFAAVVDNISIILLNLVIFLKFDGYYLLEILLDEAEFREHAFSYVISLINTRYNKNISSKENDEFRVYTSFQHWAYTLYVIAATAFVPISASLLIVQIINMIV